ncbi:MULTISPECIES: hypothetical protein [Lacticaseibacillus]|uniref:hypothetical protein n=1 Tax=Lacticaseibacillus TaxID=2759736 RepID=UPI00069AA745|nr:MULTISPECIES: hypothetical protein [Lacticaseibacillus]
MQAEKSNEMQRRREKELLRRIIQNTAPTSILNRVGIDSTHAQYIKTNTMGLLIGILSDQSVKSKKAWSLPLDLSNRVQNEGLSPRWILQNKEHIFKALKRKPALHRFPNKIAEYVISLAEFITKNYGGDPDKFIASMDSVPVAMSLCMKVKGISLKKAGLLCLILELDYGIKLKQTSESIALVDRHIIDYLVNNKFVDSNSKDFEGPATSLFKEVYPDNPALVSTVVWDIQRE